MNRRKFFGAVTAVVAAACAPGAAKAVSLHNVKIQFPRLAKGPGFIAARYGSGHHYAKFAWWQSAESIDGQNFAKLEVRTLAALQSAWKECLAYKTGDTLLIDEQAYEVFKTL